MFNATPDHFSGEQQHQMAAQATSLPLSKAWPRPGGLPPRPVVGGKPVRLPRAATAACSELRVVILIVLLCGSSSIALLLLITIIALVLSSLLLLALLCRRSRIRSRCSKEAFRKNAKTLAQ
jgi:hypothetical protein